MKRKSTRISPIAKMARKLRIAHGLEPPPKRRKRRPKESTIDPSMPSIFDEAPSRKEDK